MNARLHASMAPIFGMCVPRNSAAHKAAMAGAGQHFVTTIGHEGTQVTVDYSVDKDGEFTIDSAIRLSDMADVTDCVGKDDHADLLFEASVHYEGVCATERDEAAVDRQAADRGMVS